MDYHIFIVDRLNDLLESILKLKNAYYRTNISLDKPLRSDCSTKDVADEIGLRYGRAPLKAKTMLHANQTNVEIERLPTVRLHLKPTSQWKEEECKSRKNTLEMAFLKRIFFLSGSQKMKETFPSRILEVHPSQTSSWRKGSGV